MACLRACTSEWPCACFSLAPPSAGAHKAEHTQAKQPLVRARSLCCCASTVCCLHALLYNMPCMLQGLLSNKGGMCVQLVSCSRTLHSSCVRALPGRLSLVHRLSLVQLCSGICLLAVVLSVHGLLCFAVALLLISRSRPWRWLAAACIQAMQLRTPTAPGADGMLLIAHCTADSAPRTAAPSMLLAPHTSKH